jgi:uncharacterized protein YegL
MTDRGALDDVRLVEDNPEPRCPCVLLVDTSSSMAGSKVDALNQALGGFRESLRSDPIVRNRVEVAVVRFDSEVEVVSDFTTADAFDPPVLEANGTTRMGSGLLRALELVRERRHALKTQGLPMYRPVVFMLSDGAPYGEAASVLDEASRELRQALESRHVSFFGVGVGDDADLHLMKAVSGRDAVRLRGLEFGPMFEWLSTTMTALTHSRPGDQVALPPVDWAVVSSA